MMKLPFAVLLVAGMLTSALSSISHAGFQLFTDKQQWLDAVETEFGLISVAKIDFVGLEDGEFVDDQYQDEFGLTLPSLQYASHDLDAFPTDGVGLINDPVIRSIAFDFDSPRRFIAFEHIGFSVTSMSLVADGSVIGLFGTPPMEFIGVISSQPFESAGLLSFSKFGNLIGVDNVYIHHVGNVPTPAALPLLLAGLCMPPRRRRATHAR